MLRNSRPLLLAVAALAVVACSGQTGRSSRALSGRLDTSQFRLVDARVVAISTSGRVFVAPVATTGAFKLALPTGSTYQVRFANATTAAKQVDAFAVLTSTRPTGARARWTTLTPGGPIDLGLIGKPGTVGRTGPAAARGLAPASDGADDPAETESPDTGEEDDEVEACDLSGGADESEVESENDLLAEVDSDDDGTPDAEDDADDRPECASATDEGDDCGHSEEQEQESEDAINGTCGSTTDSPSAPGASGSAPTPVPGAIP